MNPTQAMIIAAALSFIALLYILIKAFYAAKTLNNKKEKNIIKRLESMR